MEKKGSYIDFSTISNVKIINEDWVTKMMTLQCNLKSILNKEGAMSIIIVQRQGFNGSTDALINFLSPSSNFESSRFIELVSKNDIYHYYLAGYYNYDEKCENGCDPKLTEISSGKKILEAKFTIIHPASDAHIAKYTKRDRILIRETPEIYESITKPYIDTIPLIKWIKNALQQVVDNVNGEEMIFHVHKPGDLLEGFAIIADSKWDRVSTNALYLLAIPFRTDIRCLRDLNSSHLPLLESIRKASISLMNDQFPEIGPTRVRIYIHYQPTYYHLHVHIAHVDLEGSMCSAGMAHLLEDVIENIREVSSDYYRTRSLSFILGSDQELSKLILKN